MTPPSGGVSAVSIADNLRFKIVQGKFSPGEQLPTRVELEEQFGTTSVTVQRALNVLVRDEFVFVDGRRGTYVAQNPPHLSRYALVFRQHPTRDAAVWTKFSTALCNEAALMERTGERCISAYTGVDAHIDNQEYQKLLRETRHHRWAGLIMADPYSLHETPLMRASGLARVGVGVDSGHPEIPVISIDHASFIDKALDFFVSRGRRKLAVVSDVSQGDPSSRYLQQGAAERGLILHPYWFQQVVPAFAAAARNCVHLLVRDGQNERPDALLVMDDNLVEPATLGLAAAGVRAPHDLDVVVHCNFPYPAASVVPVVRLGYDVRLVLQLCIRSIDCQRGGLPAESHAVKALFESQGVDGFELQTPNENWSSTKNFEGSRVSVF